VIHLARILLVFLVFLATYQVVRWFVQKFLFRRGQTSPLWIDRRQQKRVHLEYQIYSQGHGIPDANHLYEQILRREHAATPKRLRTPRRVGRWMNDPALSLMEFDRRANPEAFQIDPSTVAELSCDHEEEDQGLLVEADRILTARFQGTTNDPIGVSRLLVDLTDELANLVDGRIYDPITRVLWGQNAWKHFTENLARDPSSHVGIESAPASSLDCDHIRTVGMIKYGCGELEIPETPIFFKLSAHRLLKQLIRDTARGHLAESGQVIHPTSTGASFEYIALEPLPGDEGRSQTLRVVDFPARENEKATHTLMDFSELPRIDIAPYSEQTLEKTRQQAHNSRRRLQRHADQQNNLIDCYIRAQYEGFDGRIEWIWVAIDRWDPPVMRGWIAEIPRRTLQPTFGDSVEIDLESQMVDWWVRFPGGKTEGNFLSLASESEK
jgi:hypothetical protein